MFNEFAQIRLGMLVKCLWAVRLWCNGMRKSWPEPAMWPQESALFGCTGYLQDVEQTS